MPQSMQRRTTRFVKIWDRTAEVVITLGGLAVLAAMLGICVFLVWNAAPLILSGEIDREAGVRGELADTRPVAVMLVAGPRRGLLINDDGTVGSLSIDSGSVLGVRRVIRERPTTVHFEPAARRVTYGFEDGTLQAVVLAYRWYQVDKAMSLPGVADLQDGDILKFTTQQLRETAVTLPGAPREVAPDDYIERVAEDTYYIWTLESTQGERTEPMLGDGPVTTVSTVSTGRTQRFYVAARENGPATFARVRVTRPLGGGDIRERASFHAVDLTASGFDTRPEYLFVQGQGDAVYAVWADGRFVRFSTQDLSNIIAAESTLLTEPGTAVTDAVMALGGRTLIVGESSGKVTTWTEVADPLTATPDLTRLARTAVMTVGASPIVDIGINDRDRSVAIGTADGRIEMRNITSQKIIGELPPGATGGQGAAALVRPAPSVDGVFALAEDQSWRFWPVEPGHASASITSLFGKIHYEGYEQPEFIYQSTGTETSEPKYSITPLVFGTLKATVVAMLFAMPIAVLAAIYTSEFLHPDLRKTIKPAIELMASLPSVVLGFVAAILLAPLVARFLPAVLVMLVVVPLCVMLAAHAWRLVPQDLARRLPTLGHLALVTVVVGIGVLLSTGVGPDGQRVGLGGVVEKTLFGPTTQDLLIRSGSFEVAEREDLPAWVGGRTAFEGEDLRRLRRAGFDEVDGEVVRVVPGEIDPEVATLYSNVRIRDWLDSNYGSAWPGWFVVMVVPGVVLVGLINAGPLARRWTDFTHNMPRQRVLLYEFIKFITSVLAVLLIAAAGAWMLTLAGLDPRDSVFGSFSLRNTLVVGIIMGFAVIPIIYTISEDALRSVPAGLRSASLGCGATAWQTAIRVVLPVAGSGIFSACMVGLGRAVGETMIVLMATGNTPEMSPNIFSGFRALSANIATEMPEAPVGSTHYRVLFLCGLVLFAMTLVVNTIAELVRQRFRRRNAAL